MRTSSRGRWRGGEVRAASIASATADELRPELRQKAGVQEGQGACQAAERTDALAVQAGPVPARAQPGQRAEDGISDSLRPTAEPTRAETATPDRVAANVWLISPRMSPDGKDSLERGLDAGSVAAVVAGDAAVQREREARWSYLQGAYRDPHAARAALDEMVKRERWTSTAARLAR